MICYIVTTEPLKRSRSYNVIWRGYETDIYVPLYGFYISKDGQYVGIKRLFGMT